MKKVGFIGTGTMAKAIISGLLSSNFNVEICGYDIHQNNYDFLSKIGVECCSKLEELLENVSFIIIAVKPQNMVDVLQKLKLNFDKKVVLVSIAAGINEEFVASILGEGIKFVRVMPNTPLLLRKGAVAISKGKNVDYDSFDFVKKMFETSGVVCEINSSQMNDIVAINGSSPAFIYLFAKGFLNFASKKNIDADVALELFCESLVGSAAMMKNSGKTIDELISDVSSKGGTTVAGLSVLEEIDLPSVVERTCEKAAKRAFDLAK